MSDHWLYLVPADPTHQPDRAAADSARNFLAAILPNAGCVEANYHEQTRFIDCGSNWSGVACPSCGADADTWWQETTDAAFERGFQDLVCTAPCCGLRTSLNDLAYPWSVAFGRFTLFAKNPDAEISAEDLSKLEQTLGCKLKVVRAHL